MKRSIQMLTVCTLLIAIAASLQSAPRYTVTRLGPLSAGGECYVYPADINEAGAIVGYAGLNVGGPGSYISHAFLWKHGSTLDIGPTGFISHATAADDAGWVVGSVSVPLGTKAVVWRDGHVTDLQAPQGSKSYAWGINNCGQVVGSTCSSATEPYRACLWQGGQLIYLSPANMLVWSEARDINDQGQVVGFVGDTAYLWDSGTMIGLGTLGRRTVPTAINNHGQVVGYSLPIGSDDRAFIWQNGTMTNLGTLGGWESRAADINDRGQVVGSSRTDDNVTHAFMWEKGIMMDLNAVVPPDFGMVLTDATGINDVGQIVGFGYGGAFLLSPAPLRAVIDIRPSEWPNHINLRSNGIVPVAVLTGDDLDVSDVDPATIRFADAEPVRWMLEDVNEDGVSDIVFHFRPRALNLTQSSTEATLTGMTRDGEEFVGTDSVVINGPKK